MLKNKITVLPTVTPMSEILQLTAFADDVIITPGNSPGSDSHFAKIIFDCRFIPENITITSTETGPSYIGADVLRQDAKRVNLVPLSTAVFGQGLSVDEEGFGGDSERYFLNSVLLSGTTNGQAYKIRFGVANFTQTQDNNPFESLDSNVVLYYEV